MAMRYTDRGLARLGALRFEDDPSLTNEDRRKIEASLRKRFIDALLAEVHEISRTSEQFDVYDKIKANAAPEDKELIEKKQKEVVAKVNGGWQSFAAKLIQDYDAVFADMQSSETALNRTVERLDDIIESRHEDNAAWKSQVAEISEEARKLELARRAAHEENTKTLADVRDVLRNTTEITNRILDEGPLLSECRDQFLEAKRIELGSESTELRYFGHRIDAFLALVGDKPIAAYRVGDLAAFANELRFLPQRHTIDPEWKGKSLKEAIQENRSQGIPARVISYKTTKINYVGKVKTAIRWLCANNNVKYPFEYDNANIPKDLPTPTIRLGLDDEQLNVLFQECVKDAHRKRPEDVWLPLLALLTGARLGELVGLQPGNIRRYHGIYVVDLTTRISDKHGVRNRQIKNRDSLRLFALHQKLVEVGFVEWVDRQRIAGHEYLFPELHKTARPHHAASKRFQRLFARLDMGGTYVFHSLRHSFKDWTRTRQVPERTIALQAGHSLDGIALRYGSKILRSDELKLIAALPLPDGINFEVFKGVNDCLRSQVPLKSVSSMVPDIDVRGLRTAMGLSQQQFAERLEFSCGALRDWEQGRTKPGRTARVRLFAFATNPDGPSLAPNERTGAPLDHGSKPSAERLPDCEPGCRNTRTDR